MMDDMMDDDDHSAGESSVYEKELVEGVTSVEEDAREKYDTAAAELEFAKEELEEAREDFAAAKERLENAQTLVEEMNRVMGVIVEETAELLVADDPTNGWNSMYLKLVEYKKINGHCDVERLAYKGNTGVPPEEVKLGMFVSKNRTAARRPLEHPDRIKPYQTYLLNKIDFNWNPRDKIWMASYDLLKAYQEEHGDCCIPIKHKCYAWIKNQRHQRSRLDRGLKSEMTQERIKILDDIGFIFRPREMDWDEFYEKLRQFKRTHGHCNIKDDNSDDATAAETRALYRWVVRQRNHCRELKSEQKERLVDLGFLFNHSDIKWFEAFQKLLAYKELHGSFVIKDDDLELKELSKWAELQGGHLRRYEEGDKTAIKQERVKLLLEAGFKASIKRKREQWSPLKQPAAKISSEKGEQSPAKKTSSEKDNAPSSDSKQSKRPKPSPPSTVSPFPPYPYPPHPSWHPYHPPPIMMMNPALQSYPHMPHMRYPYPGMAPPYPNPYGIAAQNNSSSPKKTSASQSTQKENHTDEPKAVIKATAPTAILQNSDSTSRADREGKKSQANNDES